MHRLAIALAATMMLCQPSAAGSSLAGTTWELDTLAGTSVQEEPAPTLRFDGQGTASGNGGCNIFNGMTTTGDGTLSFGNVMSTQRACDHMELEGRFFAALAATAAYDIIDDRLALTDAAGNILAEFSPSR